MRIQVSRGTYIQAPRDAAVSAASTYTAASGASMLETVRHAAMHVGEDGSKHYFDKRIYRRRSPDNGVSWRDEADLYSAGAEGMQSEQRHYLSLLRNPVHDFLIELFFTYVVDFEEGPFDRGTSLQRTQRTYYRISRDEGRRWGTPRQVIDERAVYDESHWAPGVTYGTQGARAAGQPVFLPDGTLVVGFDIMQPGKPASFPEQDKGYYITTIYAQARPNADLSELSWRFGDEIEVDFPRSTVGCCEQALLWLGDETLFNTMRCQGSEKHGIHSARFTTLSRDAGMSWSQPQPLRYDDESTVWTPASPHRFISSSATGKTYVVANFLPGPVFGQVPRYPLSIAVFDRASCRVVRGSIRVLQDLPEGAPSSRRYTNFDLYEERGSNDLILTMPEQPKHIDFDKMTRPEDFEADCIRLRVHLED